MSVAPLDQPLDITLIMDSKDPPYSGSDLLARRTALGLQREILASILDAGVQRYWAREEGSKSAGRYSARVLVAMEHFVAEETARLIETAVAGDNTKVELDAVVDQDEFVRKHPLARSHRTEVPYPFTLQHVAAGRAAAALSRRGYEVQVYRGDRRADLAVRRLAVGLLKNMASDLLKIPEKRYYKWENDTKWAPRSAGETPPPIPAGLLAEMQAIDDFITTTAAQLEVVDLGGVSVVQVLDDQSEFEQAYPQARTLRDGVPYPIRVHRVAAARRAQQLEAAGRPSRIAVAD